MAIALPSASPSLPITPDSFSFSRQGASSKRLVGLGVVALLHVLVIYALVTGLARDVIQVIQNPLQARLIEEIKPPPPAPPPQKVVQPHRKVAAPPPPFVRRPEVQVQSPVEPVIAEVQGIATAAGCQLVATCDMAIASEEASFATPGVKIGLFCTTPMVALTRAIGRKRAMEMLLTGRVIDAATAAEWGLANRVVPAAELAQAARDLAAQIAASSSYTVALGKQAFYEQIDLAQPKAYSYAKEVMSQNALAADAQEGIGAFLEKRSPCWVGR